MHSKQTYFLYMIFSSASLILCSCSAVTSRRMVENAPGTQGLVYHLPLKKIKLTVTVKGGAKTPSVAVSESIPDMSSIFVADFRRNQIGKNTLKIAVSERGLLTSSSSKTTSQLTNVLSGIAGTLGTIAGQAELASVDGKQIEDQCNEDGVYDKYVDVSYAGNFCEVYFSSVDGLGRSVPVPADPANSIAANVKRSGFYYRQLVPFTVTATVTDFSGPMDLSGKRTTRTFSTEFLVHVPDRSRVNYLNVNESLFGDNESTLAFSDGVPTSYGQDLDGEGIGLISWPAAILDKYFSAMGKVFEQVATRNKYENAYAIDNAKRRACSIVSAESSDLATIRAACE